MLMTNGSSTKNQKVKFDDAVVIELQKYDCRINIMSCSSRIILTYPSTFAKSLITETLPRIQVAVRSLI